MKKPFIKYRNQVLQRRHFIPLVAGGIAVVIGGSIALYALRAFRKSKVNVSSGDKSARSVGENSSSSGSSENSSRSSIKYDRSFGIDIGTSNARLALCEATKVSDVLENREGFRATPAVLLFDSADQSFVVGKTARASLWLKPSSVVSGHVLLLGSAWKPHALARFGNKVITEPSLLVRLDADSLYSPIQLHEKVAAKLWEISSAKAETTEAAAAVAATPNAFRKEECAAVQSVCSSVGFQCVRTIPEAVAAVLAAREMGLLTVQPGAHSRVIVLDVGGRLTQLAVVEFGAQTLPHIVKSRDIVSVGGELFDETIVRDLSQRFARTHGVDLLADRLATQRLYDEVEAAKSELSSKPLTRINTPFISANRFGPLHLDEKFSRSDLAKLLSPLFDQLNGPLKEWMDQEQALAGVLLVGGSGRMEVLKDHLRHRLPPGVPLVEASAPEELVALGASLATHYSED